MKKSVFSKLGFIVSAVCIGLSSCTQENIKSPSQSMIQSDLTGQELFKVVFFADGVAAAKIPELSQQVSFVNQLDREKKLEYAQFESAVIAHISKTDASFFDKFKKDIQSGDHLLIEKSLEDASGLLVHAIQENSSVKDLTKASDQLRKSFKTEELASYSIDNSKQSIAEKAGNTLRRDKSVVPDYINVNNPKPAVGPNQLVSPVWVVLVAVLAVAAVEVAVVVDMKYWISSRTAQPENKFEREKLVHSLATNLYKG